MIEHYSNSLFNYSAGATMKRGKLKMCNIMEIANSVIFEQVSCHSESMYSYIEQYRNTGEEYCKERAEMYHDKVRVLMRLYRTLMYNTNDTSPSDPVYLIVDTFNSRIVAQSHLMKEAVDFKNINDYRTAFYNMRMFTTMMTDILQQYGEETLDA